jgi:hypothetical protein
MKHLKTFTLAVLISIFFSSCIFSLFPIYTDESIVFDPNLLGKWIENENSYILFERTGMSNRGRPMAIDIIAKITGDPSPVDYIINNGDTIKDAALIEKAVKEELSLDLKEEYDEKHYRMTVVEGLDEEVFDAVLVEIEKKYYLDLYPGENGCDDDNFIPVHTFMRIDLNDDKLIIKQFDMEKMVDLFESNRIRLRHENVKDYILITAQPKEIQKFLSAYAEQEDVFEKPDVYTRVGLK